MSHHDEFRGHFLSTIFLKDLFISIVCMNDVYSQVCLVPMEAKRGCQIQFLRLSLNNLAKLLLYF